MQQLDACGQANSKMHCFSLTNLQVEILKIAKLQGPGVESYQAQFIVFNGAANCKDSGSNSVQEGSNLQRTDRVWTYTEHRAELRSEVLLRAVRWSSNQSLERSTPHWPEGDARNAIFRCTTLHSIGMSVIVGIRYRRQRDWLQQCRSIQVKRSRL